MQADTVGPHSPTGQIEALQTLLKRTGSVGLQITGRFDRATRETLLKTQRRLDLPRTGRADPLTVALILQGEFERERRRAHPRRFVLDLPVPPAAPAGRTYPRSLLFEAPKKSYVPRLLEQRGVGGYEPATMACFLAALERPGSGVGFDVGANAGLFGLVAGALTEAAVVAFEPTPELADAVRRNGQINNLELRVEELALGRESGTATLHLSDQSDASNSLNEDFRPAARQVTVRVESLDDYCARTGLIPSALKIDTESTEVDVLQGGRQVLEKHRPWLMVEVLHGEQGEAIRALMDDLGYHAYHLADDGGDGSESATHDRNWLFSPEPMDDDFRAATAAWRAALERTRL